MRNVGIREYRTELQKRIEGALQNIARDTAIRARAAVPLGDGRDGGHLRDCISADVAFDGTRGYARVTAENPHAAYVEFGTINMPGLHYLTRAMGETGEVRYFLQGRK
jgi:hypothetical protein